MSDSESLFGSLKARRTVRAGIAHIIVAWLFVQIADVVLPYLGVVDEPVRWALVVSVATFPVTLLIALLSDFPWSGSRQTLPEVLVITAAAIAAAWWVQGNLPETAHERHTLVVREFDHADNAIDSSISQALVQEVSNLLTRSRSVDVIGTESATSPALQGLGAMGVAEMLNATSVLEGFVSTAGEAMSIELRLFDAAGDLRWESKLEASIGELFAVQERIASQIDSQLGFGDDRVSVETVAAERCWMPTDPEALRDYYTARHYIQLRSNTEASRQMIADAISLYESLVENYPDFSDARSGLIVAVYRQFQWFPEDVRNPEEARQRTRALAERAYADCATNGEALHFLPNQYDHENGWIGNYQQGAAFMELEPHKLSNKLAFTKYLMLVGLVDQAFELAEQVLLMNPLSPQAITNLAGLETMYGDPERAIALFDRAAELGYPGINYGKTMRAMKSCGTDWDCLSEQGAVEPHNLQYLDELKAFTRTPASDDELQESAAIAVDLLNRDPEWLTNTLNVTTCRVQGLDPVFFDLLDAFEAHRGKPGVNWYWPNVWFDECVDVWSHPRFKDVVTEAGFAELWAQVGWPSFCQPQGDSIACGRNIDGWQEPER